MNPSPPFQRAMLMSGGGSRFGYYLGIYAAALEMEQAPDVIFATCGGAIAAGLVSAFDCTNEQKQALLSEDMFDMLRRFEWNPSQSLRKSLTSTACRALSSRPSCTFPDLSADALFRIRGEQTLFPFKVDYSSKNLSAKTLEVAIVGSQLCFGPHQISERRAREPLFKQVIFSSPAISKAMQGVGFQPPSSMIAPTLHLDRKTSFHDAIHISLSDIYYLPPYHLNQHQYMGGMLDLVPFELAAHCCHSLILEEKPPFARFTAVPAFKHLLGYDPNQKLDAIPRRAQDVWINTTDAAIQLKHSQINKRIEWRNRQIALVMPKNYDQYREMMEAQWHYGYQKALSAFSYD